MKNIAPDTPRTCLSAIQKDSTYALWQSSWTKFFYIYFNFVKICAINRFRKYNWVISDELINEAIALSFTNLLRSVKNYTPQRGKFHKFFYGIINHSVLQIINIRMKDAKAVALDDAQNEIKYLIKKDGSKNDTLLGISINELSKEENPAEKLCEEERTEALKALYKELIEITKSKVSPRIYAVFEMRVVENLSAEETAKRLGIKPSMVDNDKYKFIKKLNEIASEPPYCDEIKNLKI